MKRFHVHVSVEDIDHSIAFYTALFATAPTVLKPDYAKWMLDDPRVNFAISKRATTSGVDHLGIQVESENELDEVSARLEQTRGPTFTEKATTCCYAKSDKQWVADPQGVAWETFLTHGEAPVYGNTGATERLAEATAPAPACGCGVKA